MEEIFTTVNGDELQRLLELIAKIAQTHYETELLDNADLKMLFKVTDKTDAFLLVMLHKTNPFAQYIFLIRNF